MIRHITVSIERVLQFSDKQLGDFFDGNGSEIREELLERQAKGELKIGSENCEGFCPIKGCPGHENSK